MKKLITVLAVMMAVTVGFAGVASAQTPTGEMTVSSVSEAGENDIVVDISGFTPGLAVFVLPCEMPAGGDMAAFDSATCDTANLTPAVVGDDGTASVPTTQDIPAEGLIMIAGDAAQTEIALAPVVPGAGSGGGGDDAAAALADTGVDTGLLAVLAGTMIAGGALVVGTTRRYS